MVHPDQALTKAGGRPGDLLFLTSPLAGGLVTTVAKRGLAPGELIVSAGVRYNRNTPASARSRPVETDQINQMSGGEISHCAVLVI